MLILVTGSSSGIGQALAALLVAQGHEVIGLDRSEPNGDHGWVHLTFDLSDPEAALRHGLPDGTVFEGLAMIAGIASGLDAEEVWQANYVGHRRLFSCIPRGRHFSMVAASSISAGLGPLESADLPLVTDPEVTPPHFKDVVRGRTLRAGDDYRVSKLALKEWTLNVAAKHGPESLRANVVSLGPILSPSSDSFADAVGAHRVARAKKLLGRSGEATEVAEVIAFLLTSNASWISGADVRVDGGLMNRLAREPK